MEDLFGGSSQQSVSGPVSTTPTQFQALRGPVADALRGLIGTGLQQGGGTYDPSTGSQYAVPMTAQEQALLGTLSPGGNTLTAEAQAYLKNVMGGAYLPGGSNQNPFLEAAIKAAQRPTLQGLEQTLTRDLPGRFTAAGHFIQPQGSSPFDRAAAIATRGAAQALSDIATNISSQAYTTERGLQQGAVGLSQQEVQNTISSLQASALPRLIEQYGVDKGLEQFNTRIETILKALAVASGLPLVSVANQTTASGTSSGGIIPGLTGAFSAAFPAAFPKGI